MAIKMRRSLGIILFGLLVTACATAPAATTTTNPPPLPDLELSPDGLGSVSFGLSPDEVIAELTGRFGAPDHDSDWIPAEPNIYGSCPGQAMRAIGWGSLVTIFVDDGESDLGGYFYTYTYGYDYELNAGGIDPRDLHLTTAAGIGIGSQVDALRVAYGGDLVIDGDAELDVWSFRVENAGFRGLITGPDATDQVTLLQPLVGCS
jgi:hypothetical protein